MLCPEQSHRATISPIPAIAIAAKELSSTLPAAPVDCESEAEDVDELPVLPELPEFPLLPPVALALPPVAVADAPVELEPPEPVTVALPEAEPVEEAARDAETVCEYVAVKLGIGLS